MACKYELIRRMAFFYTKTLTRQNLRILDHLRKRVITYLFETPRVKKIEETYFSEVDSLFLY